MNPPPRIFISHSAKEAEAKAVREALTAALKAAGYDVLLDAQTLQPGDHWRNEINLWLGVCDAAVVLLSEAALASPYVTYETSVLAYRNATLDPTFLIIPVLLGEVTQAALDKSHLTAAQLGERQQVRGTLAEIVGQVLGRLGGTQFRERTPVENRAKRIADLLRKVPEDMLREAGAKIALDLPWMAAGANLRLRVAVQLMSVGMQRMAVDALLHLRPYVPPLERTDWLREMVEQVGSSWVDLRCVGRIPSIAKGNEKVRAFGINACRWDAARMYLLCASYEDPPDTWHMVWCTGIHGEEAGGLANGIRRVLRTTLEVPDEELQAELEARDYSGQPFIVGLDRAGITDQVLEELRQEFPLVAFFLLMGTEIEAGAPLARSLFEMLFPQMIEGEEDSFLKQYDRFKRSIIPPASRVAR